jgi:replicative DNA helicase
MSTRAADGSVADRTPPHDIGAEQCVLGGMLLSPRAVAEAADQITVHDFYRPVHATIYRAILDQYTRNEPTDQIAIASLLAERGELARINGGADYLNTLVATVPTVANVGHYAKTVRRRARRRRAIDGLAQATQVAYGTDVDDDEIPDRVAQIVQDATADRVTGDLTPVGDLIPELLAAIEQGTQQGLSTGITDLDRLTGGMQPGQLWLYAGRPGVGKSVALADAARAVAIRQRQTTVYFSLEMSRLRLLQRLTAAEARVPLHVIKTGGDHVSLDDWNRIVKTTGDLADAPLYIEDTSAVSVTDVVARTRRLAQRGALGLVVVDYLQLMEGVTGRGNDNREREVARISRGLKVLAGDLGVPVVVAAQLNRGPETRSDHRPVLSDLRESGALEADADVVVLLHRPDYYDKESERAGEVDLIVAKNRDGDTDTVTAAAQLHYSRFVDMAIENDIYSRVLRQQAA